MVGSETVICKPQRRFLQTVTVAQYHEEFNLKVLCVFLNKNLSTFLKKVKEKCKKKNQKYPAHSGNSDSSSAMLNALTSKPVAMYVNSLTAVQQQRPALPH